MVVGSLLRLALKKGSQASIRLLSHRIRSGGLKLKVQLPVLSTLRLCSTTTDNTMTDMMKEEAMEADSCNIVRLRGLPWNASKSDIIEFFDNCAIEGGEDGIHMMTNREGRPSGEAYVHLTSTSDSTNAKEKHNKHIGKRYIEVFAATAHEMDWVMKRSTNTHEGDAVVRLRGLPYEATKEEVAHFFTGLEIKPKGITFVKKLDDRRDGKFDQKGRHSGSAFVQFKSPEIAEQALKKDRAYMGPRYVEVFKSSEGELEQVLQQQRMQSMRPFPNRPGPYDRMDMRMGGGGMRPGRGRMGMKPYRDFSDNCGYYPEDDYYDDGMYGRMGDNYGMGMRRGGGGGGSGYGGGMMNRSSGYGNSGRMGGGMNRSSSGGGSNSSANRGQPGWQYQSCTSHHIHMRGLPYTAMDKDVHDFFSGVHPVHVEIHLKPNGQATGEADVEFSCHEDAKMGFKRDRQMMGDRYIELFLHSVPGHDFSGGGMDNDHCMMGSGGGSSGGYGGGGMGGGSGNSYGQSGNFFSSSMSGNGGMGSMGSSRMGGYGSGGGSVGMGGNYTPFS